MALSVLDLPDFGGRKNPGKREILTETLALLCLGNEQGKDFLQRLFQNRLPLRVAP